MQDDEILLDRVLTAEQQAANDEAARVAAAQRASASQDNAHERGIEDLMYSRLEGRDEDSVWTDVVPPVFMAEVPRGQWSDEQKKMAQVG